MARKPVVLGWPISLILRGINAIGTKGSALLLVGSAAAVCGAYAPWLSGMNAVEEETNKEVTEGESETTDPLTLTNIVGGLITFMDMNAELITVREKRRLAKISVPGRESDFLQDLGGHSAIYPIRGKFFDTDPQYLTHRGIMQTLLKTYIGNSAVGSTQLLRLIMRTASPVPLISEHEITFAVIDEFNFSQIGGEPRWVNYDMTLIEYTRIPYLAKMAILGASNLAEGFGL